MFTAFQGNQKITSLPLRELALTLAKMPQGSTSRILIFDDQTGRTIDLDLRGSDQEICARLPAQATDVNDDPQITLKAQEPRGPGRPKLGVVAREITLLPRHWEWLSAQPGGASVAIRKLVENARRDNVELEKTRQAHSAAYHFLSAIAGDFVGFEEVSRALFANDADRFAALMVNWPTDIRAHALRLGFSVEPN